MDLGALFNSGQSCCAIERIYVHEKVYDELVEKVVKVVKVRLALRSPYSWRLKRYR
jgi:acyl-CoA reductase-like NAD-dependent aldehyde dehydrogenase